MVREGSAKDDTDAGRTPFGINLAMGAVALVGGTAAAAALFPVADLSARLVVVAAAVAAYAALVGDTRASLAVAGLGYLLFTGFLANRYGELTWHGTTSLGHLGVFALAAGLGLGHGWIRSVRAQVARADEFDELLDNTESIEKETHGA